jgi:hypothetical protein
MIHKETVSTKVRRDPFSTAGCCWPRWGGPRGLTTSPSLETTGGNGCSLREAITNANDDLPTFSDCPAGGGPDTIGFSVSGTITLGQHPARHRF